MEFLFTDSHEWLKALGRFQDLYNLALCEPLAWRVMDVDFYTVPVNMQFMTGSGSVVELKVGLVFSVHGVCRV